MVSPPIEPWTKMGHGQRVQRLPLSGVLAGAEVAAIGHQATPAACVRADDAGWQFACDLCTPIQQLRCFYSFSWPRSIEIIRYQRSGVDTNPTLSANLRSHDM